MRGTEPSITTPLDRLPRIDLAQMIQRVPVVGRVAVPGVSEDDLRLKDSTKMLLAMAATGRRIYEGTANPNAVARRRAKNRVARRARRVHRR